MSVEPTRHWVTVGSRRVHYTRAGDGPPVVLLHASPCSSKVLRMPQVVFAQRLTALAFDTPGFGLSDPLPMARPETEDFADALADTLDALGIGRVAVHGRHTGAQIAVEFAARHPSRCTVAITDGFPVFSEEVKRDRPERYLEPIVPSWDGAHLLWLWFRYREQHVFWPWNAQDAGHRADTDVPDLDFLHRGVVELLEAGDGYRVGYSTAYRHRGIAAMTDLRVPVCFGWRPGDSLAGMRERMPAGSWNETFPREAEAAARAELEVLLRHASGASPPPAPHCTALAGRTTPGYVAVRGGQVLVRRVGDAGAGAPFVLIPPLPGSSALLDGAMRALAECSGREVIAFDLPGHGESPARDDVPQTIAALAGAALQTLDAIGADRVHLCGHQGGAAVAVELATRAPRRIASLTLDAPVCLEPTGREALVERWLAEAGELAPCRDGGHLVRAWHMRRDMSLWWPWFEQRREHARHGPVAIDPAALTLELRESMKQPRSTGPALRAVLAYPMAERLAALPMVPRLLARADDPWAPCLPHAAAARPGATAHRIDDGEAGRVARLAAAAITAA